MASLEQDKIDGMEELRKWLMKLPDVAADRLQRVVLANLRDHKREIVKSSKFERITSAQLNGIIRIEPRLSRAAQKKPKRIEQVYGSIFSLWQGATGKEDAAKRVEKRVGSSTITPVKKRLLLLPVGDMLTPTGRARRVGVPGTKYTRPVPLGELEDTAIIKTRSGLRLVQHLKAGERGLHERSHHAPGLTKSGRRRTISKKRLGARSRIIGMFIRKADQTRPLDFFGSWDRLKSSRDARFQRFLDDVVKTPG